MFEKAVSPLAAGERAAVGPALLGVWNRPTGAGGGMDGAAPPPPPPAPAPPPAAAAPPFPLSCSRFITAFASSLVRLLPWCCFSASNRLLLPPPPPWTEICARSGWGWVGHDEIGSGFTALSARGTDEIEKNVF